MHLAFWSQEGPGMDFMLPFAIICVVYHAARFTYTWLPRCLFLGAVVKCLSKKNA